MKADRLLLVRSVGFMSDIPFRKEFLILAIVVKSFPKDVTRTGAPAMKSINEIMNKKAAIHQLLEKSMLARCLYPFLRAIGKNQS